MIEAYLDESGRPDGIFCVGACCYFPPKARRLEKKWSQILEGRTFHATDMNNGKGEFKDLDKETSGRMYRSLIEAYLPMAEFEVAVSVNPREVAIEWPDVDGFKTCYAVCCAQVVALISSHLEDSGIKSRVAYTFEAGHKHKSETDRYMRSIAVSESRRAFFHYRSHSFESKDRALLQTADLIAWEWAKFISEVDPKVETGRNPMRQSLEAILSKRPDWLGRFNHLSGDELKEHLAEIEEIWRSVKRSSEG